MTTDITELAHSLKAAAENATPGEWCSDDQYGITADSGLNGNYYIASCSGPEHRSNKRFIALANPANVLALVEALEKAQRANAAQDDHINQQQDRIDQLEKGHQEAAKQINSWRRMAKQNIAEREKDIAELDAARQRIAELESRTVKLPKPISVLHRREFTAAHCAIYAYPEAEVNAALNDAGIKVEAE